MTKEKKRTTMNAGETTENAEEEMDNAGKGMENAKMEENQRRIINVVRT